MNKKLDNRVVLVTDGSNPSGKAISQLFLQHGAKLILGLPISQSPDSARVHCESVVEVPLDYTQESSWSYLLLKAKNTFGRIDILINNLEQITGQNIIETSDEIWDQTVQQNLDSVFLATKSIIPYFLEINGGSIVNLLSIESMTGSPYSTAFTSSQGGIRTLSKSVAVQYAKHNIRSNCILMGYFEDPASEQIESKSLSSSHNIPMGRLGNFEELSHVVLFLAGTESRYITGTELVVDGGFSNA